jgi:hypothetical protein
MPVNLENTSFLVIIQSRTISRWIVNTRNLNFVTVHIILEFFFQFLCVTFWFLPVYHHNWKEIEIWAGKIITLWYSVNQRLLAVCCMCPYYWTLLLLLVEFQLFFFVIMSVVLCAWELLWLLKADESNICSSEPYNRWTWRGWFKDILVSTKMCNQFS